MKTALLLCLTLPILLTDTCYDNGSYTPSPSPHSSCDHIEIERDGTVVARTCTIQSAIYAIEEYGEEIHIRQSGYYLENLYISGSKDFSIIADVEDVILNGAAVEQPTIVVNGYDAYMGTHVLIQNMVITGGTAFDSDAGAYSYSPKHNGGGIQITDGADVSLIGCDIRGNTATWDGGGIAISGIGGNLHLQNTLVHDNEAAVSGGGIFIEDATVGIQNTVIYDNHAGSHAGGINSVFAYYVDLRNITVSRNTCGIEWCSGGVGLTCYASPMIITNSVFAYNNGPAPDDVGVFDDGGNSTASCYWNVYFSDIYDSSSPSIPFFAEAGNLFTEPMFTEYEADLPVDFHLSDESPLINAGDPNISDPDGSRSDMGAYGGPFADQWLD